MSAPSGWTIRAETAADHAAIHALTEAAFRGRPYAGGDEQLVIDRLRAAGELVLSLVAEEAGEIVGQVTFSRALAADGGADWYALGPVSVLPARQGEGIGAALIRQGLADLEARGARGCILTGNPDYYRRFGFELAPEHVADDEYAAYFMVLCFGDARPIGRFRFQPAFYADA